MAAGEGTVGVEEVHYFMVFGSTRRHTLAGTKWVSWEPQPLGVYEAPNATEACKLAASEMDRFGMFFAIEGQPWGVTMNAPNAKRFGSEKSVEERLAEQLDRMDALDVMEAELRQRIAAQSEGEGDSSRLA